MTASGRRFHHGVVWMCGDSCCCERCGWMIDGEETDEAPSWDRGDRICGGRDGDGFWFCCGDSPPWQIVADCSEEEGCC